MSETKEIEAELEICYNDWGFHSCDCYGFHLTALENELTELKKIKDEQGKTTI